MSSLIFAGRIFYNDSTEDQLGYAAFIQRLREIHTTDGYTGTLVVQFSLDWEGFDDPVQSPYLEIDYGKNFYVLRFALYSDENLPADFEDLREVNYGNATDLLLSKVNMMSHVVVNDASEMRGEKMATLLLMIAEAMRYECMYEGYSSKNETARTEFLLEYLQKIHWWHWKAQTIYNNFY